MLGTEERATQTSGEPHVLGHGERLRHCSRCQHADNVHTQTFVWRYRHARRHTPVHIHTAGPSQLTPCHSTDHFRSSSGTGGHMWIIIHAN